MTNESITTVAKTTAPKSDATRTDDRPRIVTSDELLKGNRELWIEHGEDMYRLRRTSSGKLYLTK